MRYFLREIKSARKNRPSIFVLAPDDFSKPIDCVTENCADLSKNVVNPSKNPTDLSESLVESLKSSGNFSGASLPLLSLRPDVKFHFFSSHTPCGDASIFPKGLRCDDEDYAPSRKLSMIDDDAIGPDVQTDDIHRTGAKCLQSDVIRQDPRLPGTAYHVVGVVRTKPGRGDRTLSVSCSDKLFRWHSSGIQVSTVAYIFSTRGEGDARILKDIFIIHIIHIIICVQHLVLNYKKNLILSRTVKEY